VDSEDSVREGRELGTSPLDLASLRLSLRIRDSAVPEPRLVHAPVCAGLQLANDARPFACLNCTAALLPPSPWVSIRRVWAIEASAVVFSVRATFRLTNVAEDGWSLEIYADVAYVQLGVVAHIYDSAMDRGRLSVRFVRSTHGDPSRGLRTLFGTRLGQ
jgi:hypothetical protein